MVQVGAVTVVNLRPMAEYLASEQAAPAALATPLA